MYRQTEGHATGNRQMRSPVPMSESRSCDPLLSLGLLDPLASQVKELWVNLDTDELAPEARCGNACSARAEERVTYGLVGIRVPLDQPPHMLHMAWHRVAHLQRPGAGFGRGSVARVKA